HYRRRTGDPEPQLPACPGRPGPAVAPAPDRRHQPRNPRAAQGQPGLGRGRGTARPPGRGPAHHRTNDPGAGQTPARLTHVMAATPAAGHHADIVGSVVMEYEISLLGRQLPLAAINEALLAADPAALVDLDGGRALLRLSTCLDSRKLRQLLGE